MCIYKGKPEKEECSWYDDGYIYISCFNHLFPAIKWEDDEPTLISDIYNPQVLDNAEREYLKTVLKPFHKKVDFVQKRRYTYDKEYLFIELYDGVFEFPNFDSRKMYLGMELNKKYKMDELGLTYPEEDE